MKSVIQGTNAYIFTKYLDITENTKWMSFMSECEWLSE